MCIRNFLPILSFKQLTCVSCGLVLYLQRETIERMDWHARSPDLNPIEHVWHMLQAAISVRAVQPQSLLELRTAVMAEWTHTTQNRIADLITSMHNRCQSVIAATGRY